MLEVDVGPDGVLAKLDVEPFGEPLAMLDDDMGPFDDVFAKLDDDMGPLDADFAKPIPVLLFCEIRDDPFWRVWDDRAVMLCLLLALMEALLADAGSATAVASADSSRGDCEGDSDRFWSGCSLEVALADFGGEFNES